MNKIVVWFVKLTGFIPQLFYFRKKIYYENKKIQNRKIKGGAIVASNHHSLLDFALLMFVFPGRDMYSLVAEVMFRKTPILSWLLKRIGCIKVDRYKFDINFMDTVIEKIKKGKVLEIFPEGRLPLKHEKEMLPFKPGAIHIALQSKAPIIPVYHDGNYGKRVNVIIGTPVYIHEMYDENLSEKENIDILTQKLRDKILELGNMLHEQKNK